MCAKAAKGVPEATPRPWLVGGLDHIASIYSDGTLRTVADHLSIGDAELIVTAVNSYEALQAQNKLLREACEAALKEFNFLLSDPDKRGGLYEAARDKLVAAIRGEKQDG